MQLRIGFTRPHLSGNCPFLPAATIRICLLRLQRQNTAAMYFPGSTVVARWLPDMRHGGLPADCDRQALVADGL
jgi:hypothetical protein